MPICTYISHDELEARHAAVSDPDVVEWIEKVESLTPGRQLYVKENIWPAWRSGIRGLFRKHPEQKTYSVYWPFVCGEVQIANFCSRLGESSICTEITREELVDYLIGVVNGIKMEKRTQE